MANPTPPLKLGNDVFAVPPPGAMRSFALQQRIFPMASSLIQVFMHLMGSKDTETLLDQDVTAALPKALPFLGRIFADLPKGELEAISRELLGDATCNKVPLFGSGGAGDAFDLLMQGRTLDTWMLLWHAIKVWYPDFFAKAAALTASGLKAQSTSEASTTSETKAPVGA